MTPAHTAIDDVDQATKWWSDYPTRKYVDLARPMETYESTMAEVWSRPKSLARSASFTNLTYIRERPLESPIPRSPSVSSLAPSLALPQHYRQAERIVHTTAVYKPHVYDWYNKAYSQARFLDTHREIAREWPRKEPLLMPRSSYVPFYTNETRRIFFEQKRQLSKSYIRGSQAYLDRYVSARLRADDFAGRFVHSAYEWSKPSEYRFNRHFLLGGQVNVPHAPGIPHSYSEGQALRRLYKTTGRFYFA